MKNFEEKVLPWLVIATVIFWFGVVIRGTRGLIVPVIGDYQRDMSITYNLLGGNVFGDPVYLGERAWYPFLMQFIYAVLHLITGISVPTLYIGYPYLILGPAILIFTSCLYFVYRKWLVVFASLFAFLFLIPSTAAMTNVVVHATGLGFAAVVLAMTIFWRAIVLGKEIRWWILAGVGVATVIYTHTPASTALCGGIALYQLITRKNWKGFLAMVGTTFVLISPYFLPILMKYHFQPKNTYLTNYAAPVLLDADTLFYGIGAIRWLNLFFILSGIIYAVMRRNSWDKLTLSVFIVSFLEPMIWAWRRGWHDMGIGSDVFGYNHLLAAIFFGFGITFWFRYNRLVRSIFIPIFFLYLFVGLPPFVARVNEWAEHVSAIPAYPTEWQSATEWVATNTALSDVFLAHPDPGYVYLSGMTGRKLIVTSGTHANLFVDQVQREADMLKMYETTDVDDFRSIAQRYNLGFIVVSPYEQMISSKGLKKFEEKDFFRLVFSEGEVNIYKVI